MNKQIWKYEINVTGTIVEMPEDAIIRCVDSQYGGITLWVEVDPERSKVKRKFEVIGTGQNIPDIPLKYLGTVKLIHETLIYHIYEAYLL